MSSTEVFETHNAFLTSILVAFYRLSSIFMRYPTAKSLNATANLYTFPHSIVLAAYLNCFKEKSRR